MKPATLPFHEDPEQWLKYARFLAKKQAGSPQEMEDAAQAGIRRMMPGLARLDRSAPAAKIRGYMRNAMLWGIREHLDRWRAAPDREEVPERACDGFLGQIEDQEERERLMRAVFRLPKIEKVIVCRRLFRKHALHRVAAHVGLHPSRASLIEHRGLARLRELVQSEGPLPRAARKVKHRPDGAAETRGRKRLMARQRFMRPEDYTDPAIRAVGRSLGFVAITQHVFAGLRLHADCSGLFRWDARALQSALLPDDPQDMGAILAGFEAAGLVARYEVDGVAYGWIRGFRRIVGRIETAERRKGPQHPQPTTIADYAP